MDEERDEELQRLFQSRSLFDELGIELDFAPDELAPPVDEEQLRRFVRKQLPRDEETEVCQLVAAYRPWFDAWCRLVRTERPD